jgi:hypothetical protein
VCCTQDRHIQAGLACDECSAIVDAHACSSDKNAADCQQRLLAYSGAVLPTGTTVPGLILLNRGVAFDEIWHGSVRGDAGVVELALRTDLDDRPRQIVDPVHGKPAGWRFVAPEFVLPIETRAGCFTAGCVARGRGPGWATWSPVPDALSVAHIE